MKYSLHLVNTDSSMSLIQIYSAESYTYEQVLALMQALDQSKVYCIEFSDGSNCSILYPADVSSISAPSEPVQLTPLQVCQNIILAAMDFGQELVVEFAAQNIISGITAAGKTNAVLSYTAMLASALNTGSLYSAISIINAMLADGSATKSNLSPFITDAILTNYKHRIQDYLGIPNT